MLRNSLLKVFWIGVLLFVSGMVQAASYTFSGASYPACSGGSWSLSGNTWTCNGSFSLGSGDTISPASSLTVMAYNGMSFAGGNTVGSSSNIVALQTNYGDVSISGTTTIYGSVSGSGYGNVTLSGTTVTGAVVTSGSISLTSSSVGGALASAGQVSLSASNIAGNVTGSNGLTATGSSTIGGTVTSTNGSLSFSGGSVTGNVSGGNGLTSTSGTTFGGTVSSSNGLLSFSGGSVAGNASGNGVTSTNATTFAGTVSGNNSAVSLTGGSVTGNINGNGVTLSNTNLNSGVASNNSSLSISGGVIAGVMTGNGITITNSTMTRGSLSSPNNLISISSSLLGTAASTVTISANTINLVSSTTVYGNVTAGSWSSALYIDGTSRVYGVCTSNSNSTASPASFPQCSAGAPAVVAPVMEYRMDEALWNGTSGEVVDNRNADSGTATGTATTTASGQICRAGNFTPATAYVSLGHPTLSLGSAFTISTWINWQITPSSGNNWANIFTYNSVSASDSGVFWLQHRQDNGVLEFAVATSNGRQYVQGNTATAQNQWQHIVGVYDGSKLYLYVNGSLQNTVSQSGTVSSPPADAILTIGRWANSGNNYRQFNGWIDETKLYASALSASQVSALYANENAGKNWDGTARACAVSGPDHLEIDSAASGLICAANTLTIKACANAACSSLYTGGVTGILSASGTPAVSWDGSSGGAAGNAFVIGSSGSITKNVLVSSAGSVVFSASSSPAAINTNTCNFGSPACTFTASNAGFVFANSSTATTSYTIPPQLSGVASSALYLRALQVSSTNPAVCTPAIISQNVAVNMAYVCNNPASCQAGNLAAINTTPLATAGTAVTLSFDANGSAPMTVRYDDAGQITLNASKTITPITGGPSVTLTGVSNAYVVAPHHFGISGVTTAPLKAGNNFSATVTAYNALSTPTANFGKEVIPEGVTISFVKYQPAGSASVSGSFSGSTGSFSAGVATGSTFQWSEAGTIDLTATLASGSYLGSGMTATGATGMTGAVGRFIPDHFDTIVFNGCAGCGFTYSGQPFTATVTARNALGNTTVNYDGSSKTTPNFAKSVTLSVWDVATGTSQNPGPGVPGNSTIAASSFVSGVATINTAVYTFTTVKTAPTSVRIRASDTDGVTSQRTPLSSSVEGLLPVNSGRLLISGSYGSEFLTLKVPVAAQYWNGSYWILSSGDSSSLFSTANVELTTCPASAGALSLTATSVINSPSILTLAGGLGSILLSAPGQGNRGCVNIDTNGTLTSPSIFSYLPANTVRATFGIYKGNKRMIFIREQ